MSLRVNERKETYNTKTIPTMEVKNKKGMHGTGPRKRSWSTYYLGNLFKEEGIKHFKPVRSQYSVFPGAFVSGKKSVVWKKPVPMSDFGHVLVGARHILRQLDRHKFDKKLINSAWNRFQLLRNLPDTQEISYTTPQTGKLVLQPGQVLFTGKTLPRGQFLPLHMQREHFRKLHRHSRKGFKGHIIIPSPGTWEDHPYKVDKQPIWIGPQFNLPSFKGTLKEEYFHTLPYSDNPIIRRTWSGPPFSNYYRGLVARMLRYRQKLLTTLSTAAVDTEKKLRKRKYIAKCTRKAIRAMQLFTLAGHNMRAKLLEKIGEAKYRNLRRATRIMRRRQTRFLARLTNLRHHKALKEAGFKRKRKRAKKRLARQKALARLPRPPGIHSPYFRKRRAKRPVQLGYRSGCGRVARYVTIDEAKRINLGKLKPRALINNRKLKRTISTKVSPARVNGNKRTSRANKTG